MKTTRLFTYGTLMLDDVFGALLNRVPLSYTAQLPGYKRVCVDQKIYPGIFSCPGETVTGKFYEDILPDEWPLLDWFESDLYKRVEVDVYPTDSDIHSVSAWTYRVEPGNMGFLNLMKPWDLHTFIETESKSYIEMCKGCPDQFRRLQCTQI